jgi:hypothetical protein
MLMMTVSVRSRIGSLHCSLWWLLTCTRILGGQERVEFSDFHEGRGEVTWWDFTILLFAAPVCYALARAFASFIETRRLTIPWRTLRRTIPAGTLIIAWCVWWTQLSSEAWTIAFLIVNLPAAVVAGISIAVLRSVPVWFQAIAGSVGWWLGWYGAIRLAEWKAWANVPAVLNIDRKE